MNERQLCRMIRKYEREIFKHTKRGCDSGTSGSMKQSQSHLSCIPILAKQRDRLKAELAALDIN